MHKFCGVILAVLFSTFIFLTLIPSTSATYLADITYDYVDNGGSNYTFTHMVNNTSDGGSTGALDFFMIEFDADDMTFYSGLTWTAANGWVTEADDYFDPGAGLGPIEPGYVSADDSVFGAGGGGIAQGNSLGGFSVNFGYSGSKSADQQLFSWFAEFGTSASDNGGIWIEGIPGDVSDDYWILGEASGTTAPIPEPSSILLVSLGLLGLLVLGRKWI